MNNKVIMKGMEAQYITLIHESVKVCDSVKEFIDNAIDAKASKVEISFEDGILVVKDNSPKGMVDVIEQFAQNYKSHIADGKNTIGIKGVGAKDAMLRLSDFFGKGSVVTIITSNGKISKKLTWNLCQRTESINSVYIEDLENTLEAGTEIMITNPCDVNASVMGMVKSNLSYTYSYKMKFEGLTIMFKNGVNDSLTEIESMDYFYLDKLCGKNGEYLDRLTTQGNYEIDGFFFIVRQNVFKKNGCNEYVTIPAIQLFISENAERRDFDSCSDAYSGAKFGSLFNGRFISNVNTTQKMHFEIAQNTGGSWRCRTLILVNNNTYEVLSGKSNKSKGVSSLKENSELKNYSIVLNSDLNDNIKKMYKVEDKKTKKSRNMNIYECLEMQYSWVASINSLRKRVHTITMDNINAVVSRRFVIAPSQNEEYHSITENENYKVLTDIEKKMICLFEQKMKEQNVKDTTRHKILVSMLETYKTA